MPATATKLDITPLADKVVIEILNDENEKSSGGIFIPDTAREKPQFGSVVAIGPGAYIESTGKRQEMSVQVGQKIMFAKYGGTDFKHNGVEYKILAERDILGIVQS